MDVDMAALRQIEREKVEHRGGAGEYRERPPVAVLRAARTDDNTGGNGFDQRDQQQRDARGVGTKLGEGTGGKEEHRTGDIDAQQNVGEQGDGVNLLCAVGHRHHLSTGSPTPPMAPLCLDLAAWGMVWLSRFATGGFSCAGAGCDQSEARWCSMA